MKKLLYILSVALFLVAFASCQKEDIRPLNHDDEANVEETVFNEGGTRGHDNGGDINGTNGITDPDEDEDFDEDERENIVDPDEDEDFDEDEDGK